MSTHNPFWGAPLRYLIGSNNVETMPGFVTLGPYMQAVRGPGLKCGYINLFDEENTRAFPPYMKAGATASEWHEGQIDPSGPGWNENLKMQATRAKANGLLAVDVDNPDSYGQAEVCAAYDLVRSYNVLVFAKNPLSCSFRPGALFEQTAVVGSIVECDCGSPREMNALRNASGRSELPVWFVFDGSQKSQAQQCASQVLAGGYLGMGVTYSTKSGEAQYNDAVQVLAPNDGRGS